MSVARSSDPRGAARKRCGALQDRLGAINDCVTTADYRRRHRSSGHAERRKIKAALNRLLERRAADFRIYWRVQFGPKRRTSRVEITENK